MLTSVRLKNLKSFREAEIRLGPINFLVGPNMSGKSNFLWALQLLRRISFSAEGEEACPTPFPGASSSIRGKGRIRA